MKREMDLKAVWEIVSKRKWIVTSSMGILVLLTAIFSFLTTPLYKSTVTLLIEEESSRILNLEETFDYQPQMGRNLRFFNTQLKILSSKSLAERVAKKMNLLSYPEFRVDSGQDESLMSKIKNLLSMSWIKSILKTKNGETQEYSPRTPYSIVADKILKRETIKPIPETNLVEIRFKSSSPILAAEIANIFAQEFRDFSIEKRFEITKQASDFLSEQIASVREDLAAKERELQRYGQEKEIFYLGNDTESTKISELEGLSNAYTQARIDRIKSETTYLELRSLNADALPQFVNNPVIHALITDYKKLKSEYEEKKKVYKTGYPEMEMLKARLDSMEVELKEEITKAVDTAGSEHRTNLKREWELKQLLEKQKADVTQMNSNAILYSSLKIEVETRRTLLKSLEERLSETRVSAQLAGLSSSNISIIDKAVVPEKPDTPKKTRNIIVAILVGLLGGIALCFFLDYLDNTVKSPEDLERLTDIPSFGMIPYLPIGNSKQRPFRTYHNYYSSDYTQENKNHINETLREIRGIELVNHHYPELFISEDYRAIRTSILLSHPDNPPQTIVFSSAMPQEGKSASVANMAVSFAQLEKRVLIIDADLRKPRLHKTFKVRNVIGLSGYLTGVTEFKNAVQPTSIEHTWLLPSGLIPPHPAELLNSAKMRDLMESAKAEYDFVVIDTPPILAVSDPIIIASMADMTVFVIKAGKTTDKQFLRAIEELKKAKVRFIGAVFNELKIMSDLSGYRDFCHHYYYKEREA